MTARAPRVLVSGVVLGQAMGGARRHAAELLPRAAHLLEEGGGGLAVLEGEAPLPFDMPPGVVRLRAPVPFQPPWRRALGEARHLSRILSGEEAPYDLVHFLHLPVPPRLGTPFTHTLHDLRNVELESVPRVKRLVARRAIASAVGRAACTVVVSDTVRRSLEARFRTRRVAVVGNAGDHLPVLPRRPGAGAPLLAVGHVEPRKNLELLVRALALAPDLPALHVAGRPKRGADARLARLARELGVAERVRFSGPVEESALPELYATAACVVIPSALEGFGLGVLEAERARAPLAISDAGALPEVAEAGVPRFGVDDPAGLVAAVRVALATPATELAARAEAADARYSWKASAERLVRVWSEAAGRH